MYILILFGSLVVNLILIYGFRRSFKKINEKVDFHHYQIAKIEEKYRQLKFGVDTPLLQTLDSFDFQWSTYNEGKCLSGDHQFMSEIQEILCKYTGLERNWFKGKKVMDLGAGSGRFTYGLLELGCEVTAVEQSKGGCKQIAELCDREQFKNKLNVIHADLLIDDLPEGFDMVFCYGVVHHTGNTYQALKKACDSVRKGGKIFLMIYGYPENYGDYLEVNHYEKLRYQTRNFTFAEKIKFLERLVPKASIHGFFDAISPIENDLMRFEELVEFLSKYQIKNIKKTVENRNLHVVGEKI